MTTENILVKRRNKRIASEYVSEVDNEQVQLDWIKGLVEQIDFANRPDVLPKYFLKLNITRRRWET